MIDDRILFNTYIFDSNVGIFIDVEEENEDDDSDDYLASDDYNNLPDYDIIDEIFRS
jgi:hypothetical protein